MSSKSFLAIFLASAVVSQADFAVADHAADDLAKGYNPNFIACLMAVDDAAWDFRVKLDRICFTTMLEICHGKDPIARKSQVIDCIVFETQRGINFLQTAVTELPETFENFIGFKGSYERRRDSILSDIEIARAFPKPEEIEDAIKQGVTVWGSATMLFYLARETGTPLQAHVAATFIVH